MNIEFLEDLEKNDSAFVRICTAEFKLVYSYCPEFTEAEQELFELHCWDAAICHVIEKKTGKPVKDIVPIKIIDLLISYGAFETLNNIEFNLFIKGIRFD